jgi:hypothetical protein
MWLSAIKLAVSAGSHIYKNKHEKEYQGKLLTSRDSDWKDEFILLLLSLPIVFLGIAVWSDNPEHMEKMQLFFEYFGNLPFWYQTIFVGVIASVYGLKATDLIKRK